MRDFARREKTASENLQRREIGETGSGEREERGGAAIEILHRCTSSERESVLCYAGNFGLRPFRVLGGENRIPGEGNRPSCYNGTRARCDGHVLDTALA